MLPENVGSPVPSAPEELSPQHHAAPMSSIAHVCKTPSAIVVAARGRETRAGDERPALVPSPSCPYSLSPQHTGAGDSLEDVPSLPRLLLPQHHIEPSL